MCQGKTRYRSFLSFWRTPLSMSVIRRSSGVTKYSPLPSTLCLNLSLNLNLNLSPLSSSLNRSTAAQQHRSTILPPTSNLNLLRGVQPRSILMIATRKAWVEKDED